MTQEEKQLLLKDICARLPYGAKVQYTTGVDTHIDCGADMVSIASECVGIFELGTSRVVWRGIEHIKPYLRPMSSMTEEEFEQMVANSGIKDVEFVSVRTCKERMEFYFKTVACDIRNIDWLNVHHFDYRGLIEKSLALEAKEGMYKIEQL